MRTYEVEVTIVATYRTKVKVEARDELHADDLAETNVRYDLPRFIGEAGAPIDYEIETTDYCEVDDAD